MPTERGRIAVAEGTETALSFATLSGIPTWATLGSANLARFKAPQGIAEVVVAGDNGNGEDDAYLARQRLREKQGVKATVVFPRRPYKDFNDELLGEPTWKK